MEFPLYGKFRGLSPRPMDHDIGPVHGGLSRWQGGVAERPGDGSEGDDDGGARRDLSWRRERGNGVRQNVPGYGGSLL
jgi:hypothetical protein